MDEAVGALQRVWSSANHSAVVEMVMALQTSYLSKHIQQHIKTMTTSTLECKLNILLSELIQMAFTPMCLAQSAFKIHFGPSVYDFVNIHVLS